MSVVLVRVLRGRCASLPCAWSLLTRRAVSTELTAVSSIPSARLVVSEDAGSATISSQPFLPIVVGWAASSHRPLSKYATVYTGHKLYMH